jgi:NAD(P)H dehydrogenase (quinone)
MAHHSLTQTGKPILVTGATGRQGGTGRAVAKVLLDRGLPVRALVRALDERSEALRELGLEIVVGDFGNYRSLIAAFDGVESAYFCYPVGAGIAEAAGFFAGAGREQGLKRIVDLSLATTRVDSPSPQGRAQWVAEQIFEWAGFDGVHLRIAAFFMENVLLMEGDNIRQSGRIANSFGDKALSWISGVDVGSLAANLLINTDAVKDRILIAGGVELLTFDEVASKISTAVGKPVRYEELTPDDWRAALLAGAKAKGGEVNVRGIDHLVAQSIALKSAPTLPVTNHVRQITGREPVSFSGFVKQHLAELIPSMHAKPFVFLKKENPIKIKSRNIPAKTSTNKTHQKNI